MAEHCLMHEGTAFFFSYYFFLKGSLRFTPGLPQQCGLYHGSLAVGVAEMISGPLGVMVPSAALVFAGQITRPTPKLDFLREAPLVTAGEVSALGVSEEAWRCCLEQLAVLCFVATQAWGVHVCANMLKQRVLGG